MDSGSTSQESGNPEMSGCVPLTADSAPPIPSQENGSGPKMGHLAAEDKKEHIASGATSIADDIQALKAKIADLEKYTNAQPASQHQDSSQVPPFPGLGPGQRTMTAEEEQYKQMARFLYEHRRNWAARQPDTRDNMRMYTWERPWTDRLPDGPWVDLWYLGSEAAYKRPDPFELPHEAVIDNEDADRSKHEDYDRTIDYGLRRERLRKNFEWDLDRLFLAEEYQNRQKTLAEAKKDEKKAKDTSEETSLPSYAMPKLNRIDWDSFDISYRLEEKDSCAIDILMGEPEIDDDLPYENWFGATSRRVRKIHVPHDNEALASMAPGQAPLPERICLHSQLLTTILGRVTGVHIVPIKAEENLAEARPIVFIRPFKALVYREQALRDWRSALKEKFELKTTNEGEGLGSGLGLGTTDLASGKPEDLITPIPDLGKDSAQAVAESTLLSKDIQAKAAEREGEEPASPEEEAKEEERGDQGKEDNLESSPGGESEDDSESSSGDESEDLTKSETALAHLECLLDFIDSEITAKRTYLESPDCRKVAFADLWYLFRPGVEVISSDGKQAYRVIGVDLVRHSVIPAWKRWYSRQSTEKSEKPDFSVTCVYIDFDGTRLGPVSKSFDFKKYDGDKEITSLDVYPIRFHPGRRVDFTESEWTEVEDLPQHEKYRRKLIRRGAKFLDVASVKHMYYAGPTLTMRDDVESPVVIDFETAFSVEDDKKLLEMPNLEFLAVGGETVRLNKKEPAGVPPPATQPPGLPLPPAPVPQFVKPPEATEPSCQASCCLGFWAHNDRYVDQRQRAEYIESLLRKSHSTDGQPSIAVIPRRLKELQRGPGRSYDVSEDELLIMSYRVFGFVLRSRQWAQLDLTFLTEVYAPINPLGSNGDVGPQLGNTKTGDPPTAFERLVLEEGHQSMIVSLISQHFRDKESAAGQREQFDIVKGKGKGLILLLHGAPGVGKTSTAEGVAELFQKPLFQITCGDLGVTAKEVEKALEMNFALASKWGCILLLDEADVFLAERTKEDFKRNGLVAVFLRVLEYYAGILFLTTNRVGDFDEAFASRIHISLYYPELNRDKTGKVFQLNMDMIQERFKQRGRRIEIATIDIINFAYKHFDEHPTARWNGRQIRNACQTALALAEFHAQGDSHKSILKPDAIIKLGVEPFETVRNAYLQFTKYMHDLYGTNATRRARDGKIRANWADDTGGSRGRAADWKSVFLSGPPNQQRPDAQQVGQQQLQQQQSMYGTQGFGPPYGMPQAQAYPPQHNVLPHMAQQQPGSEQLAPQYVHQPQPQYSQPYANTGYMDTSGRVMGNPVQPSEHHNPASQQAQPSSLTLPPLQGQQSSLSLPSFQSQVAPQQPQQQTWPARFNPEVQPQYGMSGQQMPPDNTLAK